VHNDIRGSLQSLKGNSRIKLQIIPQLPSFCIINNFMSDFL